VVPKRAAERARHESKERKPEAIIAAGQVAQPPADPDWHPLALTGAGFLGSLAAEIAAPFHALAESYDSSKKTRGSRVLPDNQDVRGTGLASPERLGDGLNPLTMR
jgi:hypothetical protein